MKALNVKQAQLAEAAGWSKGSMSEIYNGKTGYSRRLVNEAANALNIQPYELLMAPEDAMALRRQREESLKVVENTKRLGIVPGAVGSDRTGTDG
ncbi:MAG: helix-turn-helix transcriptional regulator [Methylobacterium mesophilicum]|nr:helix-turn-helix transcriptional regulator [Methylobacterium mesophilicum]